MKFIFTDLKAMADSFENTGKEIRKRIPSATSQSQRVMRAEAHAYEQCAFIIRNVQFTTEDK